MKRSVKIIIGISLVLIIEVIVAVFAFQHFAPRNMIHGNRNPRYSMQMNRPDINRGLDRNTNIHGRRGMNPGIGSGQRFGMRPGMVPEPGFGMRPDMVPGPGFGMRRGMGQRPMDTVGRGFMRNDRFLGNIPDLSEKQKMEIADLRQKQQEEMKNLRDSQRNKMMDLLTPEQKKFLDPNSFKTNK